MKESHRLKVKVGRKIFHANRNKQKKTGVAMLIPDKIDFKRKVIMRHSVGNYIIPLRLIQQKDITLKTYKHPK